MAGHEDRGHALLSASGAHRWLKCPPSALLGQQFPDSESEAAREGTLAHELCEIKLRNYFFTTDYGKRKMNKDIKGLKEKELWQNEMLEHSDTYLGYVKAAALSFDSQPYAAVEKRVDFGRYVPDGFGTADCILLGGSTLWVIDFKYGRSPDGRVSAEENPQLMLYALGAYEAYKMLYPVEKIKLSIVQPRLPDGISEWECTLGHLLEFGEYAKTQAGLAVKGGGEFNPGRHTCRFCRAGAVCRARAEKNVELAFFKDKKPPFITNDEVGDYLLKGGDISMWMQGLISYALKECLAGRQIRGWKAVEGRSSRTWINEDEALKALVDKGIPEAVLYKNVPLTLAQIEKEIGKKEFSEYAGQFVIKPPGKPTLVQEQDKRPAITNKITAGEAFKE